MLDEAYNVFVDPGRPSQPSPKKAFTLANSSPINLSRSTFTFKPCEKVIFLKKEEEAVPFWKENSISNQQKTGVFGTRDTTISVSKLAHAFCGDKRKQNLMKKDGFLLNKKYRNPDKSKFKPQSLSTSLSPHKSPSSTGELGFDKAESPKCISRKKSGISKLKKEKNQSFSISVSSKTIQNLTDSPQQSDHKITSENTIKTIDFLPTKIASKKKIRISPPIKKKLPLHPSDLGIKRIESREDETSRVDSVSHTLKPAAKENTQVSPSHHHDKYLRKVPISAQVFGESWSIGHVRLKPLANTTKMNQYLLELDSIKSDTSKFLLESQTQLDDIIIMSKNNSRFKKKAARGNLQKNSSKTLAALMKKLHLKVISWNLTPQDLFDRQIVPNEHATSPNALAFLKFARDSNNKEAMSLLKNDRYLIFEYNHLGQNLYHLCAKRDNPSLLTDSTHVCKGNIDSKDITGRTPLKWALETRSIRCAKMLLGLGASPFGCLPAKSFQFDEDYVNIRSLICEAIKKHIQMKYFGPYKDRIKFYSSLMPFESLV